MRFKSSWTDQQIALLRTLHSERLAFSQIAIEINKQTGSAFTRNACIGQARRIGLDRRAELRLQAATKMQTARHRVPKIAPARVRMPSGELPPDDATLKRIESDPVPAEFLGIALIDLESHHCRYPRGGDNGTPILFCGQPKMLDSSYCPACHARCVGGRFYHISDAERERRRMRGLNLAAERNAARRRGEAA